MIIYKKADEIIRYIREKKKTGCSIGFVPTMGALHPGHLSLVETARQSGDLVVCSIFVNPTQFNDKNDFDKYPSSIGTDIDLLEKTGCDIVFLPDLSEVYPSGTAMATAYPLGYLETVLEGKYRPGHFQGVCQVVERLLRIVTPNHMYLGQKDYQQCMVIKKLIGSLHFDTQLVICATLREKDGLAMSSRNMRLSVSEREKAVRISETLLFIKKTLRPGYLEDLKERATQYLRAEGFQVDYVEIANAETLELLANWDGHTPVLALIAAALGNTRLIDNMLLNA